MSTGTWDAGGDGTSWDDDANWSGATYPQADNEVATIDSGSAAIDLPAGALTIGELIVTGGFSGSVTSNGSQIDVRNDNGENGKVTWGGGTLNASDTWNVYGDFDQTGGTLDFTGGQLAMVGGGAAAIHLTTANVTIPTLTINKNADAIVTLDGGDTIIVTTVFVMGNGQLNGGTIRCDATVNSSGNFLADGTTEFLWNQTGDQTINTAGASTTNHLQNVTIDKAWWHTCS